MGKLFIILARYARQGLGVAGKLWKSTGSSNFMRLLNVVTFGYFGYEIYNAVVGEGDDVLSEASSDSVMNLLMPPSVTLALASPINDIDAAAFGFKMAGLSLVEQEGDTSTLRAIGYLAISDYIKVSHGRIFYTPESAKNALVRFAQVYTEVVKSQGEIIGEEEAAQLKELGAALLEVYSDGDVYDLPQVDYLVYAFSYWADLLAASLPESKS